MRQERIKKHRIFIRCSLNFTILPRVHIFSTNRGATSKFQVLKGWHEVQYWGPTNIRHHHTKFTRPDDLEPGICAHLMATMTFSATASVFCTEAQLMHFNVKSGVPPTVTIKNSTIYHRHSEWISYYSPNKQWLFF